MRTGKQLRILRLYADGEPLLNKDLPRMIRYAKDANVSRWIEIVSNGSLLTHELSLALAGSGLDRIRISIEGVDEASYRDICGKELDYDAFVDNIRFLYENRGSLNVYVKTVDVCLKTKEEEEKFLLIFRPICDEIFIEHISNTWPGFEVGDIFTIDESTGLMGGSAGEVDICPFPFYSCCITPAGELRACIADWENKIVYGNVFKDNFYDVWNSKAHGDFLVNVIKNGRKAAHSVCASCGYPCVNLNDKLDGHREELLAKFGERAQ